MNNAVVLVVDKFSLDIHLGRLTAGVKYPANYYRGQIYYTKEFFSILADLMNVKNDTSVFFYKRRIDEPPEERGFVGEFRSIPIEGTDIIVYEDFNNLEWNNKRILGRCSHCGSIKSKIEGDYIICESCGKTLDGHILPLRFCIRERNLYNYYLDDNTAYIDLTDRGRLSTLIFRKIYGAGRERSVNPILPEEAEKIRRLLERVSQQRRNSLVNYPQQNNPYIPQHPNPIINYLDFNQQYPLKVGKRLLNM